MTDSQLAMVRKLIEALEGVFHDIKDTDFGKFKICDRSGLMVSEALTAAKAEFPEKEGG